MAKLLNDKMSSQVHINNSNRHTRLCKQTKGAEGLAEAIAPKIIVLKEKRDETDKKRELYDAAHDDLMLRDAVLDDSIRNVADVAKQYDRNNPGRPVFTMLFPDGKYSDIVRAPFAKEVDKAEQIAERIKALGEEHVLAVQYAPLTRAIAEVRTAISNKQQAKTNVEMAVANEGLAQADLRKQYEFNYLDAVKLFGRKYADRLFPRTVSKAKVEEEVAAPEV